MTATCRCVSLITWRTWKRRREHSQKLMKALHVWNGAIHLIRPSQQMSSTSWVANTKLISSKSNWNCAKTRLDLPLQYHLTTTRSLKTSVFFRLQVLHDSRTTDDLLTHVFLSYAQPEHFVRYTERLLLTKEILRKMIGIGSARQKDFPLHTYLVYVSHANRKRASGCSCFRMKRMRLPF